MEGLGFSLDLKMGGGTVKDQSSIVERFLEKCLNITSHAKVRFEPTLCHSNDLQPRQQNC